MTIYPQDIKNDQYTLKTSKMIKIPILYINKDTTLQQKIVVSTQ